MAATCRPSNGSLARKSRASSSIISTTATPRFLKQKSRAAGSGASPGRGSGEATFLAGQSVDFDFSAAVYLGLTRDSQVEQGGRLACPRGSHGTVLTKLWPQRRRTPRHVRL